MLKNAIRFALSLPFRLLPGAFRYRLVQWILDAAAGQSPAKALRSLLQMESHLTWCIDRTAVRYGGGVHAKHRLMGYHDFFVERVSENERVLDIGSGNGALAHSIASQAGATVVGIDLRPVNVTRAREMFRHPNLGFVQGDALCDLPDEPFGVVILSNVLEHIEHRVDFLRRVREQINPTRLLIRVPSVDRDWRVPLRKELGVPHFSDGTHFTEYTEGSFRDEMRAAGLAVSHLQINWGEIWAEVTCHG